jgi:hypothetical protein
LHPTPTASVQKFRARWYKGNQELALDVLGIHGEELSNPVRNYLLELGVGDGLEAA